MFSCTSSKNRMNDTDFENIYNSSYGGKNNFGFELIQSNEDYINLITRLQIEEFDNNDGLYNVDFESRNVVIIYLGERSTGGYSVEVDSIYWKNEILFIKTKEIKPLKGQMVTMALTNPFCITTIPKVKNQKIELK